VLCCLELDGTLAGSKVRSCAGIGVSTNLKDARRPAVADDLVIHKALATLTVVNDFEGPRAIGLDDHAGRVLVGPLPVQSLIVIECHGIEGGSSVETSQGNRVRCDILQRCPLLRVS
jgi:hypothetical protein